MTDHANEVIPLRSVASVDGRRRQVREYKRMREQLLSEFGGADLPATQLACIETLAQASALARAEFRLLTENPSRDLMRFVGVSNLVLGSSRALGLKRVPKTVSLADYLEARDESTASGNVPCRKTRKPRRGNPNGA